MSSIPVCAIHYHPDAYRADRVGVKGRHAAGAGFLSGYFRHGRAEKFVTVTPNGRHAAEFSEMAKAIDLQGRNVSHLNSMLAKPGEAECLLVAGPGFDEFAWERRTRDQRAYSLCGITHTLSSDRVIEALSRYNLLPLQPWDALICTSQVARDVVRHTVENYGEYLERRLGAAPKVDLKLPIIPLGVDSSRYAADAEARARLRKHIGAAEEDFVILFLGRFTFHAKAHPVPMYLAAEGVARRLQDRKVHFVMAGQAPNETIYQSYLDSAAAYTEKASVHFVDGQDDDLVHASWQGADAFLSLSDNIQETFGLTPIEAMAAGLPAVVSDWDGYKDTIVDGETGFRIPTVTPSGGDGFEYAYLYQSGRDNYDRFVGRACMSTGSDLAAAVEALVRLAEDPALRHRMGAAGRRRAAEVYDWSVIVRAYEELWLELRELRHSAPEVAPRQPKESASPLYPDPFDIFRTHPSFVLSPETLVSLAPGMPEDANEFLSRHSFVSFSSEFRLSPSLTEMLLKRLGEAGTVPLAQLEAWVDPVERGPLRRTLPALAKFGLIRLSLS